MFKTCCQGTAESPSHVAASIPNPCPNPNPLGIPVPVCNLRKIAKAKT